MGEMKPVKPIMRRAEAVRAMLEINAAGNRAILRPDGTLVSEPLAIQPDTTSADLIDWSRPA